MPDPYSGISKSIDKVASAVDKLKKSEDTSRKSSERSSRRVPVNIDLLTSEEVDELRALVGHEGTVGEFSASRMADGGPKVEGMYLEFSRLGLCEMAGGVVVLLSPMAHWAVEKSEQRAREREEDRRSQRRHDYALAALTTFIGGLLAIVGSVVGALIG